MPDRDKRTATGAWGKANAGETAPDPKDTDQVADPDGAQWIAFANLQFSNFLRAVQRKFALLHRCNVVQKCLNADLVDGKHASDLFRDGTNGVVSGCGITDNGDGTIDIASGVIHLRISDDADAELRRIVYGGESSLSLTNNTLNYVFLKFTGDHSTAANITTTGTLAYNHTIIGTVYRTGTTLHITTLYPPAQNVGRQCAAYVAFVDGLRRESGLSLTETGTRNIAVSAGLLWNALNRSTYAAKDTSGSDTFSYYYRDGLGDFTEVAAQTAINNTQYDDGSGTLATLSNNKYGVHWVYIGVEGDLYVVYGRGDYSKAEAEVAQPPADLPGHFQGWHELLVGKIIIQKSASSFYLVESAFTTTFVGTIEADHGALGGLGDDDHPQYMLDAGTSVDNTIPRFNGTDGRTTQTSGVAITDGDDITGVAGLVMDEQASLPEPVAAGEGEFWVKNDEPNTPYFTDDASTDHPLLMDIHLLRDSQTSDQTSTSNSTWTLSQLNVSVEAATYLFEATFFLNNGSGSGYDIDFGGGTCTLTDGKYEWTVWDSTVGAGAVDDNDRGTALDTGITNLKAGSAALEVKVTGTFVFATSGTFIVRFRRANGFSGTLTFQEHSNIKLTKVSN